jgi:hypothetical protein
MSCEGDALGKQHLQHIIACMSPFVGEWIICWKNKMEMSLGRKLQSFTSGYGSWTTLRYQTLANHLAPFQFRQLRFKPTRLHACTTPEFRHFIALILVTKPSPPLARNEWASSRWKIPPLLEKARHIIPASHCTPFPTNRISWEADAVTIANRSTALERPLLICRKTTTKMVKHAVFILPLAAILEWNCCRNNTHWIHPGRRWQKILKNHSMKCQQLIIR